MKLDLVLREDIGNGMEQKICGTVYDIENNKEKVLIQLEELLYDREKKKLFDSPKIA